MNKLAVFMASVVFVLSFGIFLLFYIKDGVLRQEYLWPAMSAIVIIAFELGKECGE